MLQFFRINDPYRIIFVFLILVAIRAVWIAVGLPLSIPELKWLLVGERLGDGFTMYRHLYDHTGPLSAFIYKNLDIIFGRSRWVHMIFSTILVIVQASMFNSIMLRNKAYDENTYLPAFFYVVCMSAVMDFFALSPQLMALTFILASLDQIFRRIDNIVTDRLFVTSGIYLGLAAGFYLPAIVFFPIFLLSLLLFSSAILRRLILLIYGTLVVFLIISGYFIWRNAGQEFVVDYFQIGLGKPKIFYITFIEYLQIGGALFISWLISLSVIFTVRSTNYQQKMQQVMVFFIVAAILIAFISRDLMSSDLVFFIPTISFFLVYYFLTLKRRFWKIVMPFLIVFGLLVYPNFWIKSNPNCNLMVKPSSITASPNQKVLGIGLPISE